MKRLVLLIAISFSFFNKEYAQIDSCKLRFSLLTCSPGEELYSIFGHSALRLIDSAQGFDIVFNYGSFNFNEPNFYTKFGKGNLLYYVSVENLNSFIEQYRYEKRNITEQVLNLSCTEKQKLNAFLKNNIRDENKYYLYNFLFDNCSSRLKDIVKANTNNPLQFKNVLPKENTTFRNLMHEYLDKAQQPWTKMGLDFLLGANFDKKATNEQAFFLPEYLMKGFDNGTANNHPIVVNKSVLLTTEKPSINNSLLPPVITFSILLAIAALLSFQKKKWAYYSITIFDFLLFFATGLTGLVLTALWLGRTDTVCRNNFNLLWALPTHLVLAFFVFTNNKSAKKYWLGTTILLLLLLILWPFWPQQINVAVLPLASTLLLRSFILYKTARHDKKMV